MGRHRLVLVLAALAGWSSAPAPGGQGAMDNVSESDTLFAPSEELRATHPPSPLRVRFPLLLVENRGQADPAVAYYAPGRGRSVGFTSSGLIWSLGSAGRLRSVVQEFAGARKEVRPEARDRRETRFSWFRGPRREWLRGVPSFGTVVYRDLWPGIDLVCTAETARLKTCYLLGPGADPGRIRFRYRGADSVRLSGSGALVVETAAGSYEDEAPVAWQERDGRRTAVEAAWEPGAAGADGTVECGFRLGAFDPALPLVVDPAVAMEAGYIGGFGDDRAAGVALDGEGNAVVAGTTDSTAATFPVSVGPDLTLNESPPDIYGHHSLDAFVAKVRADGTGLLYCGYIGGDENQGARGVAVDSAGRAYVCGWDGPYDTGVWPGGSSTAFIVRVAPDGTDLDYRIDIGGPGRATIAGIAVDAEGRAWVAGSTSARETIFPVVGGPDLTWNGGVDGFVARVAADGSVLDLCGYVGGAGDDVATCISLDAEGNALIAGTTGSAEDTFPVVGGPGLTFKGAPGADDEAPGPTTDAFVAKVWADGGGLAYCGYIGGTDQDIAAGIAVDGAGCAYVVGTTDSPGGTFPSVVGPALETWRDSATWNWSSDAFIAKVRGDGTALDYCGFIGGGGWEQALAVAVDPSGVAFVAGLTVSNEATLPVTRGPNLVASGTRYSTDLWVRTGDVFVARVPKDGARLDFCGFLGGTAWNWGELGVALDPAGSLVLAGSTSAGDSGFPASAGALSRGGERLETFVVRVPSGIPPDPGGLDLRPTLLKLRHRQARSRDSLLARGTMEIVGGPSPGGVDPRSGGLVFSIAGSYPNARAVVPPGDPGWRVDRRGVQTWRSPRGSRPRWRIRVDPRTGIFEVRESRADNWFDWRDPSHLFVAVDGASGSVRLDWERLRHTRFPSRWVPGE